MRKFAITTFFRLIIITCLLSVNSQVVLAFERIDSQEIIVQLDTFSLKDVQNIIDYKKAIESLEFSENQIKYYQKGLSAALALHQDSLVYRFNWSQMHLYAAFEKFLESKKYALKGLEYAESSKNKRLISHAYLALGNQTLQQENIDLFEVINYYLKAIEIGKISGADEGYIHPIYTNIAGCFFRLGEIRQAIDYLNLVKAYFEPLDEDLMYYELSNTYSGLISCYKELEEKDSMRFYTEKYINSVELLEKDTSLYVFDRKGILGIFYAGITEILLEDNELDRAKIYYEKSHILEPSSLSRYFTDVHYAAKTGDVKRFNKLVETPPVNLDSSSYMNDEIYLENLIDFYEDHDDYKNSFLYLKKYQEIVSTKLKKQKIKFSAYSNSQIEALNNKIKVDTLKQEQKLQSKLTILSCGVILLLIIVSFLLYYAYRQLKTKNNLLNQNLESQKTIEIQSNQIRISEQQKNKLYTNIAHELQTPLNIIEGLGKQLAKSTNLDDSDQETLQIIVRNSHHLSQAAHQMMAIDLPTVNNNDAKKSLFVLQTFIQSLLLEFRLLAAEKEIILKEDKLQDEPPCLFFSDVQKINTILKNLLANAIKYTQRGGTVKFSYRNDLSGFHTFEVNDNGRGIAESDLPTLFDRYFQSENNEAEGGFGLGLAICKEYIDALNGELTVDSKIGQGSTFMVKIPKTPQLELTKLKEQLPLYQFPDVVIQKPTALGQNQENTAKELPQILIVEDNLDFCKYLEAILKDTYYLKFVHDGKQAIDYLKENKPNLIITDWMMEGIDGLKMVKHLKSSRFYNQYPILMLTARSLVSDKIRALRVGIDDYLLKPVDETTLKARIKYLLSNHAEPEETNNKSIFPTLEHERKLDLSLSDQDWLIQLEKRVTPLISDFNLSVDKIAELSELSTKHLNRKIKEITGLTAKKYIQEIRYWEARRMLETGTYKSVKAVCFSVGFKDLKHFSRKFKERFEKYPREYLLSKKPV